MLCSQVNARPDFGHPNKVLWLVLFNHVELIYLKSMALSIYLISTVPPQLSVPVPPLQQLPPIICKQAILRVGLIERKHLHLFAQPRHTCKGFLFQSY